MLQSLLIASPHMNPFWKPFRSSLTLLTLLFCCAYWAAYWSWLAAFLIRASEGTRTRFTVPAHCMQSRIHDWKDSTSTSTTTSLQKPTYDQWHTLLNFFHSVTIDRPQPWPSFPIRLFPTLCMCFLVHMWFYNLILRCQDFCWDVWKQCTCKTINVLPMLAGQPLSDQVVTAQPPKRPSSRKTRNAPQVGARSLAMFLSVFCNLSGVAPFSLASQKNLTQRLRKFRSFQGELQSNKLPKLELEQLQLQLKSSSDVMTTYAETALGANVQDMLSAVIDSGCSFTTFNTFKWVDKSSIRRLAKPIRIDGIAGGLDIEYFGVANLEVLLPNGKVQPFPLPGLIHESLPQVLISPQAFLKANHAQDKTIYNPTTYIEMAESSSPSDYEPHFRIFHNRSEWHKDGQKLLDLDYDSSFLPRITLFRQGTALNTTKSLFSAFQSEAEQGAPPLTLPNNRNLSVYKNLLLLWHAKLGHMEWDAF